MSEGLGHPTAVLAPDAVAPEDLVALTVPLGHAGGGSASGVDLAGAAGDSGLLFERDGVGLAGRGQALRIALPGGLASPDRLSHVAAVLGRIQVDDAVGLPGCGPVAMGSLPFDRSAPSSLVVPSVIVGVDAGGAAWRTTVAPRHCQPMEAGIEGGPLPAGPWPPDQFSLCSPRPHEDWCASVERAVQAIRAGQLAKVVLAREVVVRANRPFLTLDVLRRLLALYPSCTTFSMGGFLGASPELLVSRRGATVRSHPLAGTVARSGDPDADTALTDGLLASAKERHEHGIVVEAIVGSLAPLCTSLRVPEAPSIVSLRNVSHLGTLIEGRLEGSGPQPARGWPTALELAACLHPTPAVAGSPRLPALDLIDEIEELDRGGYAGPVGWVDRRGDGDWVVGIRSAVVSDTTARLMAGVGIVADSEPRAELMETQLKLQALLAALVRP